ncbi:MAG: serine hydrolase [Thermoleophilia bacterium]|nr:serine hydrolase [Thermoleophilia bacterium]
MPRPTSLRARPLLAVLSLACLPALLGLAPASAARSAPWRPHVDAARRYARHRQGEIAFAVIDQRGRVYGYHAASTAPAASVFKVMLLASFLRMRHGSRLSEHDRALLAPMIRRSDSVAATEVRDIVGRRRIERLARVAGMRDFRYRYVWGESRTSPRDQVRFMEHLMSYIPVRHRGYARYLLCHIIRPQRWGIGRVVPDGWRLFLKGGWGSGSGRVDHQVAILKRGRHRIELALFTQFDPDHDYGKRTLRGLAARLLGGLGQALNR